MPSHHFISYSSVDAKEFALTLYNALTAHLRSGTPWIDKHDIKPGRDWDEEIVEAIRACDTLLFAMSPDSVEPHSICKNEWTRALRYKKPVIPLLLTRDVEVPFGLGTRQYIDFTGAFQVAVDELCAHLQYLASAPGQLQAMKDRLVDARRDLRRAATDTERIRVEDEIALLEKQIADQQLVVENPERVAARAEQNIARGLERERQPSTPISPLARSKFINPPPGIAPAYFQDRAVETLLIADFLKDDSKRLVTIVGRGGVGKTALVCRLLKSLETGELPDNGGPLQIDGVVYLSAIGTRRITFPNLYADLCKLLPEEVSRDLHSLYKDPKVSTELKMQVLLTHFTHVRTVLLLDNFEDVVSTETRIINDVEVNKALHALLSSTHHGVKVILTSRTAPYDLAQVEPGRQMRFDLDEGLASPHAENVLRALDVDGKVGLTTAPEVLLDQVRQRTRGFPKALEALFAILSADRSTSLTELLEDTRKLLPENVVETLVGESFSRLDIAAQQVMQALAVFGRPVSPVAVDFLLQSYRPGLDSAPILNRLVNMQFVRKESGLYYLHPVDKEYALARVSPGVTADRRLTDSPPFTQFALFHRGANYFKQIQKPRADWQSLKDLTSQLAEFDLRCAGHDHETAARVLETIDLDYLRRWGHISLIIELRERLMGRLTDSYLARDNAQSLGDVYDDAGRTIEAVPLCEHALQSARDEDTPRGISACLTSLAICYEHLGQTLKAIKLHEEALAIDRGLNERWFQGSDLHGLAGCYGTLGQTLKAIALTEEALAIARETGDRESEGLRLGYLGWCYSRQGQIKKAIEFYEQWLAIARESGYRIMEGSALSVLGSCYLLLGQSKVAIDYQRLALDIARETGYRYGEGFRLSNLADSFLNIDQFEDASLFALEGAKIAKEILRPELVSQCNCTLAEVYLCKVDLVAAQTAAEAACQCDYPDNNYRSFALLGLVALRQKDHALAQTAFRKSILEADSMIGHDELNYSAFDTKGLASAGAALCGDTTMILTAVQAYRSARAINSDPGVIQCSLRLLDLLLVGDGSGTLAKLRQAADGSE